MTTYQNKTLYCNSSLTLLTTPTGSKADKTDFFYKSSTMINWFVVDNSLNPVDLTDCVFEFKMKDAFNGNTLINVPNSNFVANDIQHGYVSCLADFNQAAIGTYLDLVGSKTAQCSLWATVSGVDYLLVAFECNLWNLIF